MVDASKIETVEKSLYYGNISLEIMIVFPRYILFCDISSIVIRMRISRFLRALDTSSRLNMLYIYSLTLNVNKQFSLISNLTLHDGVTTSTETHFKLIDRHVRDVILGRRNRKNFSNLMLC